MVYRVWRVNSTRARPLEGNIFVYSGSKTVLKTEI